MAKDIDDLGEKIGGARKDSAVKTGPRPKRDGPVDDRPGWARRYVAAELIDRNTKQGSGQWTLLDTRKKDRWTGSSATATRQTFTSRADAERAIPLLAVSQKHYVREAYSRGPDGKIDSSKSTYEIWRKVSDRKTVKAVAQAFESREAAMAHMATNAGNLLGTARGYGEEILAKPDKVVRKGPDWRKGDVDPKRFMADYKFRGVEFGHWQGDRQQVMNMAYDAMRDLADITGIAPESLTFRERLALAFGARGSGGKNAARAHYEPQKAAVNLTREGGAGTLAHEWMHALDHHLAQVDDPKLGQMQTASDGTKALPASEGSHRLYASNRVSSRSIGGDLPDIVRDAYRDLVATMMEKPTEVTVEASRYEKGVENAKASLKSELESVRRELATEQRYGRKTAPASAEQLAKFDALASKLLAGEGVATERKIQLGNRGGISARNTNAAVEEISSIMKAVRGRAGWDSQNEQGPMDRLARSMNAVASQQKLLADAKASPTKTVMTLTDFAREAKKLDQARTVPYWTTREEMVARGFSAYVEDKLASKGRVSTYLSYGSDNMLYTMFEGTKPFPEGAEREAINAKFDKLFEAMRESKVVDRPLAGAVAAIGARDAHAAMQQAKGQDVGPGLRGTQNPENLEAILKNRAADADLPKSGTHEVKIQGVATEYRADAKGDPYKFKSRTYQNVGYDEHGYPKAAIIHANTREEYEAKVVAAQKEMSAGAAKAEQIRRAAEVKIGDNAPPDLAKMEKAAAKLEAVAKRTIERAQAEVDAPRLMNTARRARMGSGVVERAQQDIADAKTALKIAEALRRGEAGALSNVKSLADIRALRQLARDAEYATDRKLNRGYKPGGHGLQRADVENISGAKGYVRLSSRDLSEMKAALAGKKGLASDFRTLERYAERAASRNSFETTDPEVFKAMRNVANAIKKADSLKTQYPHQVKSLKWQANKYLEGVRDFERSAGVAGADATSRQKALHAFLDVRENRSKPSPAQIAEQNLIGLKMPGYFPTPEALAKRMAELADIKEGQTVLEPSAGSGRLADAAKARGANVDTVEMQYRLRDVLEKKGHRLVADDFTAMEAKPAYDKILMNPPFEKGQDMAHVKRAYEMLKPGGKMVAIMGEGSFFRSDAKASEFRTWLESVKGTSEKLPEGTFKESNTGVNTRLVVIEKPAEPAYISPKEIQDRYRAAYGDRAFNLDAKAPGSTAQPTSGHNQPPSLRDEIKGWLDRGDVARGAVRDNLEGALRDADKGDLRGATLLARRAARNSGDAEINRWADKIGERHGWSDAARDAAADARGVARPGEAKPKDPATMSAVERAIAKSEENAAKLAKQGPQLLPKSEAKPRHDLRMMGVPADGSKPFVMAHLDGFEGDKAAPRIWDETNSKYTQKLSGYQLQDKDGNVVKTTGDVKTPATPAQEVRKIGRRFEVYENGQPIKDAKGGSKWFGSRDKAESFLKKRASSVFNKLGAFATVAAPAAAAIVAYDATRSQAKAAGASDKDARGKAVAAGAIAGGTVAAIGYGITKGITLGVQGLAAVAPVAGKVAARAVPGLGIAMMGYGAYHGYQRHGVKGAMLGLVGADSLLDLGKTTPSSKPVNGRLSASQKVEFASANATYSAMKSAPSTVNVEQFERTRRLPSGTVVHEIVHAHNRHAN